MRPQKQFFRGQAAGGAFGDCHRTCIAMILNMDRDDVPHFMADLNPMLPADHPDSIACEQAEQEWLRQFGLATINVPFPGDMLLFDLMKYLEVYLHGAPVILGCRSAHGNHSVVIHDGEIHNPNDGGIHGPMKDGMWWLTIYSVGQNWTSPKQVFETGYKHGRNGSDGPDEVDLDWREFAQH